jgi:DNA-binding NarL/FixJ family response regulator
VTNALLMRHRTVVDAGAGTVAIQLQATDPISQAGILGQLQQRREIRVVAENDPSATVVLAMADTITDLVIRQLRSLHRDRGLDVVLVIGQLDPRALVAVVEAGVCSIIPRAEATSDRLVHVLQAAARGQAQLPPDLVRHLLDHVGRLNREVLEPRGLSSVGLTQRERDVLALVADGLSTREIALRLAYSERTIKNVLQDLTIRLHLRNRTQAVAYAVRNGWI